MSGFFVVFEGLDGSGKGTIVSETKRFLVRKGVPLSNICVTAEPTNGFYGKKIRELLRQRVDPLVNAKQFLDLYVADRREHVESVLKPALANNQVILCDRYKYSTFVYQSLQGVPLSTIMGLHECFPVPDLVFVLDVPVEVALKRISNRSYLESFEKADFMRKVRSGFLGLKKLFPGENIFVINASNSIGFVKKQVFSILEKEASFIFEQKKL